MMSGMRPEYLTVQCPSCKLIGTPMLKRTCQHCGHTWRKVLS